MRNCGDCGAKPGEVHQRGCDVERCARCGYQAIACHCVYEVNGMNGSTLEEDHPEMWSEGPSQEMYPVLDAAIEKLGGRLPWTGTWPGEAECIEFGWYSSGPPWVECTKDAPGAGPDLNRLARGAFWDPQKRRYVKH